MRFMAGLVIGLILGASMAAMAGVPIYALDSPEKKVSYALGFKDTVATVIALEATVGTIEAIQLIRSKFDCLNDRDQRGDFSGWLIRVFNKHQKDGFAAAVHLFDEACK